MTSSGDSRQSGAKGEDGLLFELPAHTDINQVIGPILLIEYGVIVDECR